MRLTKTVMLKEGVKTIVKSLRSIPKNEINDPI
jgi:hypothetical protein